MTKKPVAGLNQVDQAQADEGAEEHEESPEKGSGPIAHEDLQDAEDAGMNDLEDLD
jgi:hypothetical protein